MSINNWWTEHQDEFIDDFGRLISVPSISMEDKENKEVPYGKSCVDVLNVIESIVRRFGFDFVNDSNQYGLLIWQGESDERIGLFSHLDVVPEGPGWNYPPYSLTCADDILIGRGTGDNKGPALAVLYALRYLKESGWKPKHTIIQFYGVNEECGMHDIEYFTEHNPMPVFSLIPDSSFPVCYGEKGVLEIDASRTMGSNTLIASWHSGVASNSVPGLAEAVVRVPYDRLCSVISDPRIEIRDEYNGFSCLVCHGIAAHTAFPEGSDSAQNILASALLSTGLFPECDESLFRSILSLFSDYYGKGIGVPYVDDISGKLTHVGGFSAYDGNSSAEFRQNINIRYTITADYEVMYHAIEKTLADNGFAITEHSGSHPMYVDRSLPVIDKLTAICNEELGMDLKPYVMGGGTYARKLKNAVGYGPGIPGDSERFGTERGRGHQPDEYISRKKLDAAFAIYTRALPDVDAFF